MNCSNFNYLCLQERRSIQASVRNHSDNLHGELFIRTMAMRIQTYKYVAFVHVAFGQLSFVNSNYQHPGILHPGILHPGNAHSEYQSIWATILKVL